MLAGKNLLLVLECVGGWFDYYSLTSPHRNIVAMLYPVRVSPDYQGVYERDDLCGPQMAGGICTSFFQVL